MNFTDKDLKQLESIFVKEQPASVLEKLNTKLCESSTWRGLLMIVLAIFPQLGLNPETTIDIMSGLALLYGVNNVYVEENK